MLKLARTVMVALVTALLVFGIIMLYSASYSVYAEQIVARQLGWIAAGMLGALVVSSVDYHELTRYSTVLMVAIAAALAYLALASVLYRLSFVPRSISAHIPLVGGPVKGSFRWFRLGGFSLQPSEFAKPVLILFLAACYNRRARHVHEFWRGFLEPMLWAGSVVVLVLLGGSLSTALLTGGVVFAMALIAGVRLRYLIPVVVAGASLVAVVLSISPERRERWTSFRDPETYQQAEGYQLWGSQLALGSGGWRGLGFTNSRMKQRYLPEVHTDFIVAVVGEELGFLAVLSLMIAYVLLVVSCLALAVLAADREGALICSGVAVSFALHAFVNIGVVTGFLPTTGITAPLVSYGGSSMVSSLLGVGLLLNVARVSERMVLDGRDLAGRGTAVVRPWEPTATGGLPPPVAR